MKSKFLLLAGLLTVGAVAVLHPQTRGHLLGFLQWASRSGGWGLFLFFVVYVLASVFFVPASILSLGAGAVFGLARGFLSVWVSASIGAVCAFLLSRYLLRDWIAGRLRQDKRLAAFDAAVARQGWRLVMISRCSPIFPFSFLNYAFGLTSIGLAPYAWSSAIGIVPGVLVYVYLGTLAGEVAGLSQRSHPRSQWEWALYALGLVATILVMVFLGRTAKAALRQELGEGTGCAKP